MELIDQVCEGEEINFRMKLFRKFIMTYGIDPDNSREASFTPKRMARLFNTNPDSISRQLKTDRLDHCLDYCWEKVVGQYDPDGKRII